MTYKDCEDTGLAEPTARELIERAREGDGAAIRRLYEAHYPAVLRLGVMLLQDRQDAEDATQEAFVYAFKNLERYDPQKAPFVSWLRVIVTSRCRDLYRKKRRRRWLSLHELVEGGQEPEDTTPGHRPEEALALSGVQQAVWDALEEVPRKSRQALILRYYGELSYPEIAQALGCPLSTAKSRVAYGLSKLASLLHDETE